MTRQVMIEIAKILIEAKIEQRAKEKADSVTRQKEDYP